MNQESVQQAVLNIFRDNAVEPGKFLPFSRLRAQWPSQGLASSELVRGIQALESAGHIVFQDVDMGPFLVLTPTGYAQISAR